LVALCGGVCEYSRVLFSCVAETIIETLRNAAQAPQACEAMPAPATSQNVAQEAVAAPRCVHFKSIKRVYAIARDAGLNVKADEAMRAAFSRFLGRAISSREELNGRDWLLIGDAIKARHLAW
jgi:pyrroline-5-carboxylate reductase